MSDGAEGPRSPPAPESPEPEPPLESETPPPPAEPAEEASTEARRPRLLPVWILLGAALLSGAAWAVTDYMGGGPPPDEAQVPLIAASAEPWKVRPDDPGGLEIPNRDALIYETLNTADPEEGPERILPPPEEPLSPPRPAADVADELAVAAIEPENAAAAPVAAPAQEPVPEPPVEAALEPFLEPEATEPAPVAEAPAAEPETPPFVPAVPPRPPKPGTLAALQIDAGPLTELEPPAPVEGAPLTEPDAPALLEEAPSQEPEMAAAQPDPAMASRVPLPIDKPVGLARTTRVGQPAGESATAVSEPLQSPSQSWRYVQLGASNARGPLEGHWEMLRRRHDDVLVGLSPLIMPVDSGDSGITYRLRAGPLSDRSAAQRVCAQLKLRGLDCFVPRD